MDRNEQIACPCCGDPMDPSMVVCWDCWHITNRLEADVDHIHPSGTKSFSGYHITTAVHVTSAQVTQWDNERNKRNEAK